MMPVPPSISAQMVALTEPPLGDVSRWDKLGQTGDGVAYRLVLSILRRRGARLFS